MKYQNLNCNSCNSYNYCDSCNYCDFCNCCDYCNYCNYCNSCNSCDYCDFCNCCDYCNYCNYCNSCNSCDSCDSCNYCDSCKNIKMTEYNLFCWSTDYNSDTSFQQKRYRVFNVEVSKEEYNNIKIPKIKLEFDHNEDYQNRYQSAFKNARNKLTREQKLEFYDIPHFNWEGFTYITGVEKEDDITEMTLSEVCLALGKNIKIIK